MNRMASFLSIYNDIEQKLAETSLQLTGLQEEIKKLQKENESLKQQAAARGETRTENIEHTINQINTTNNDTIYKIKKEINEIVREIDNCIGILNAE